MFVDDSSGDGRATQQSRNLSAGGHPVPTGPVPVQRQQQEPVLGQLLQSFSHRGARLLSHSCHLSRAARVSNGQINTLFYIHWGKPLHAMSSNPHQHDCSFP